MNYSMGSWEKLPPLEVVDRLVHMMKYSQDFIVRISKVGDGLMSLEVADVVDAFVLSDFLQSPVQTARDEA